MPGEDAESDVSAFIRACPIVGITRSIWRGHRAKYDARDATGSKVVSGRYHLSNHDVPDGRGWRALYTSMELATALGEIQRNVKLTGLVDYQFTEISVELEAVADCRNVTPIEALLADVDYSAGQSLAQCAIDTGAEAILVPSATRLGDNLVIIPDSVRSSCSILIVRTIAPNLVKQRLRPSKVE